MARGVAVGLFWGVSIIWGVQIIAAIFFAKLVKGNKIIAATCTAVSNPLTNLPLYTFCYFVGHLFIHRGSEQFAFSRFDHFNDLFELGPDIILVTAVGSVIVGVIFAILGYLAVKLFAKFGR
ncbi:MAG: DUF2062 domain-containing protein [Oligoflexia bacterium]|nr:DUF2062 domain-containing protein [Oligoflexia bacterium]